MVRTYIYLTQRQHNALFALAKTTGRTQSELIREAIDRLIERLIVGREAAFKRAAGMWKDRADLADIASLRKEWDRGSR